MSSGPRDQTLRVQGKVGSTAELAAMVVKRQSGHCIRVSDVARVEDGAE